jgi:hypothetical protein
MLYKAWLVVCRFMQVKGIDYCSNNMFAPKRKISNVLEVTDSGNIHWLLGIEIWRNLAACTIPLLQ